MTSNAGSDTAKTTPASLNLPFIFRLIWSETDSFSRRRWVFALLLLVASSTFAALAPVALKLVIDDLTTPADVAFLTTALLVGAYVMCHWVSRSAAELRWAMYGPARQRLQRRVSLRVFSHLMALPFRFHVDRRTGAVNQTLTQGVTGCQMILDQMLLSVLPVVIEFSVITVILIHLEQPIVLYVFAAASVLYTVTFAFAVKLIGQQSRNASTADIDCSATLTDSIMNYEVVKYFNAEAFVRNGYDQALAKAESGWVRLFKVMTLNGIAIATVFGLSLAVSVGYAAYSVARGSMTIGAFVLVNAYMLQVVRPLELLGAALQGISRGLGFVSRMLDIIRQEPEPRGASEGPTHPVAGSLCFDRVSFSYSAEAATLRDISFTIPPGGTLAIVGASGAGKSSLVRLLMRLYEPDRGCILLDGVPISGMAPGRVRDAIAVVPQDTILFNDTIAYNIAFGRPDTTREEIESAARIAHLHEFIHTLPAGYDTVVGERGVKLSGGERQRVAIARAALKRPRIYVFDEATAALDTPTERAILQDLHRVSRGSTTLVIAHRLSTISHADEIIVLERGTVVERGAHSALIRIDGKYAAAYRAQQNALHAADVRALSVG